MTDEFCRPLLDLCREHWLADQLPNLISVEPLRFEMAVHRHVQERLNRADCGIESCFDVRVPNGAVRRFDALGSGLDKRREVFPCRVLVPSPDVLINLRTN